MPMIKKLHEKQINLACVLIFSVESFSFSVASTTCVIRLFKCFLPQQFDKIAE